MPGGINYTDRRIYANIRVNGKGPVKVEYDTGADITILTTATASQLGIQNAQKGAPLHICGVGGSCAPVQTYRVTMQIENTPAFNTTVAVEDSPSDLLCTRDVTQRYHVDISATKAQLIPITGGALAHVLTAQPTIGRPIPQLHPRIVGANVGEIFGDVDADVAAFNWNISGELGLPELIVLAAGGYFLYHFIKKK
jgi:Aspartyl protease